MNNLKLLSLRKINNYKFGELFFLIGTFFLCSSLVIGGLLLLISFFFGSFIQSKKINEPVVRIGKIIRGNELEIIGTLNID